jgi:hypothetical protein
MVKAASRGDMVEIYALLDNYVAEQGHPLTDEQIVSLARALLDNLHDKETFSRALSESGTYGRMMQNISPTERMSAREYLNAQHERGR